MRTRFVPVAASAACVAAFLAILLGASVVPAVAGQARGREEQNQGGGKGGGEPPAREREERNQEENPSTGFGGVIVGDDDWRRQRRDREPHRGHLVYVTDRDGGDWELYLSNADGGRSRRLTRRPGVEKSPRFSPDARFLVFAAREGDPFRGWAENLFVLETERPGNARRLTERAGGADGDPAWSPDGQRVFFTSDRDGDSDIYSVRAQDGTDRRQMTNDPGADREPGVSPDGRTVAFVSDRDGTRRLWLMNADGTDQRPVAFDAGPPGDVANPVFSPDGGRIAFSCGREGGRRDIYTVLVSGADLRQLTLTGGFHGYPAWSPDGRQVAFTSDRGGKYAVYVVDAGRGENLGITRVSDRKHQSGQSDWR